MLHTRPSFVSIACASLIAILLATPLRADEVKAGDRFGMIKFGSRTDVLVPVDDVKDLLVKVGDKVKGGSTILLRLKP